MEVWEGGTEGVERVINEMYGQVIVGRQLTKMKSEGRSRYVCT